MRAAPALLALAAAFASMARAGDVGALIEDAKLWQSDLPAIARNHEELRLEWNATTRQSARVAGASTVFGLSALEAVLQLEDGRPAALDVLIYARGDAGDISREQFAALVSNAQQVVAGRMGSRPAPVNDQLKTTGIRREGLAWTNATTDVRLLWSYSTKDPAGRLVFRAEYVKLSATPAGARLAGGPAAAAPVSLGAIRAKVRREANGDVLLADVPMVDQGEKGYCAVATAERVMRYYGMEVDQNELAQLAASSAAGGTDPRAMLESLRRVGVKLGCKVKVLEEFGLQEFMRLVDRYNRAARKEKLAEIKLGYQIDITDVYNRMDTALLRDIRTKSAADVKNFLGDIARTIDQGVPLLWGVQLGKVEEKELPKQIGGGHMRLIVGYNPKTPEVLFSDSWGPGHELKRMALDDAWTITCALYLIEPRRTTP